MNNPLVHIDPLIMAAMHDYNYFKIGGIGQGYSFGSTPGNSALTTPMLRQSDAILGAHVSGTEGAAINAAVSSGALRTNVPSIFHGCPYTFLI